VKGRQGSARTARCERQTKPHQNGGLLFELFWRELDSRSSVVLVEESLRTLLVLSFPPRPAEKLVAKEFGELELLLGWERPSVRERAQKRRCLRLTLAEHRFYVVDPLA
jgi:hypothetical protein